jgi:hypothetical protein
LGWGERSGWGESERRVKDQFFFFILFAFFSFFAAVTKKKHERKRFPKSFKTRPDSVVSNNLQGERRGTQGKKNWEGKRKKKQGRVV